MQPGAADSPLLGPPGLEALADAHEGTTQPQLSFDVAITRVPGARLGVTLRAATGSPDYIIVEEVTRDGQVAAWNASSQEPQRVQAGDRIVKVNGVHGDIQSMIQEMNTAEHLSLHIFRRRVPRVAPDADTGAPVAAAAPPLGSSPLEVAPPTSQVKVFRTETPAGVPTSEEAIPLPKVQMAGGQKNAGVAGGGEGREASAAVGVGSRAEVTNGMPMMAQELVLQVLELEDRDVAEFIRLALERRPWLQEAVVGGAPRAEGEAPVWTKVMDHPPSD